MTGTKETEQSAIWQYVPINEFALPVDTVTETVKEGIAGFWRKLRPNPQESIDTPEMPRDRLESLSDRELSRLVAEPVWRDACRALSHCVMPWFDNERETNVMLTVTGPPYSGTAETLELFAKEQGWRVVETPSAEQIFSGDMAWLEFFKNGSKPWVLPRLDKCYFRHIHGLNLVRTLSSELQNQRVSPGIIGCGSWARSYLRYAAPGLIRNTYVAQALDHDKMSLWLQSLAFANNQPAVLFREQDNGALIFPENSEEKSDCLFMRHLAAYCRGNAGVGRAVWRHSLCDEPQQAKIREIAAAVNEDDHTFDRKHRTVWVLPWQCLQHPATDANIDDHQRMLMHALLLHDGLSIDLLLALLPISRFAIIEALQRLEQIDLVTLQNGEWRIGATGYPEARRILKDAGFLIDDF
ncbi:MAG: hypothetical protein Kow0065_05660 [Methylomicrobium sp.]